MRRGGLVALAAILLAGCGGGSEPARVVEPADGMRIAAVAVDGDRLLVAEEPIGPGCPVVRVGPLDGALAAITGDDGPTCVEGARLAESEPGGRAAGLALDRAIWAIATPDGATRVVMGSAEEGEELLQEAAGPAAPRLGTVVAAQWLRLYGAVDEAGTGWVTSGNRRELWRSDVAYVPVAVDAREHVVVLGPTGTIAAWHPHGERYGEVPDADAQAAAVSGDRVAVLRRDGRTVDVRDLTGAIASTFPLDVDAAGPIDMDGETVVLVAGGAAYRLDLGSGSLEPLTVPDGLRVLDVAIATDAIAVLVEGDGAPGRQVLVLERSASA